MTPFGFVVIKIKIIFRHALKSKIADTVTVLLGKKPKVGFIVDECKDVNNFQYFSENSNKIELKTLGDGYFDYSDYQYGPEDCEKGAVTLIICATNFNCNFFAIVMQVATNINNLTVIWHINFRFDG